MIKLPSLGFDDVHDNDGELELCKTISSIETGLFNPTAKLALVLCIALDKKFEDLFYFE